MTAVFIQFQKFFSYDNERKLGIRNGIISKQRFIKLSGYVKTERGKDKRRIQYLQSLPCHILRYMTQAAGTEPLNFKDTLRPTVTPLYFRR
jgi:hypothetical protein